jgi:hypothetical protein
VFVVDSRQARFAVDYVRVLACAAGLVVTGRDRGRDGVDLGLRRAAGEPGRFAPAVEVQVRPWTRFRPEGGELAYPGLSEVGFNQLAGDDYTVPRHLVVVHVPGDAEAYADFSPDGLRLRHLAYHRSLRAEPRIPDPDPGRRRPVTLSTGDVLTARTLLALVPAGCDPAAAA